MSARAERARESLLRARRRSQAPSWRLPGPGGLVLPGGVEISGAKAPIASFLHLSPLLHEVH